MEMELISDNVYLLCLPLVWSLFEKVTFEIHSYGT